MKIRNRPELITAVRKAVFDAKLVDFHSHLFPPSTGDYFFWGFNKLMTYHYVLRDFFAFRRDIAPAQFWELTESEQADMVWQLRFLEAQDSCLDEARLSVLHIFKMLGLPLDADPQYYRDWFAKQDPSQYLDMIMERAGITGITMTNCPILEQDLYAKPFPMDRRFFGALRFDGLFKWEEAREVLRTRYQVVLPEKLEEALPKLREFIAWWCEEKIPSTRYLAASLPPDFLLDDGSDRALLVKEVLVPCCEELGKPCVLMPGVIRQIRPDLRNAGDTVAPADMRVYQNLARDFQAVDFWISPLHPSNQYDLTVMSCSQPNVKGWGAWWYQLEDSQLERLMTERLNTIGSNFLPVNSDARVTEHLFSKWEHARRVVADVLYKRYERLLEVKGEIDLQEIVSTIDALFDLKKVYRLDPTA